MGWLAESNSVAPGLTVSGSRAFFFFRYIWGEKFIFELFSNVNFSHLNNIWTKIAKLSNSVALDLAICFVLSNYLSDIW